MSDQTRRDQSTDAPATAPMVQGPTKTAPGPAGWYYASEEEYDRIYGPYDTRDAALDAWLRDHGADMRADLIEDGEVAETITDAELRTHCPMVGRFRRPAINCNIFDGDWICDGFAALNEIAAVTPDGVFDLPADIKDAMAAHLARALYDFCEAHNVWDHFRGHEDAPESRHD